MKSFATRVTSSRVRATFFGEQNVCSGRLLRNRATVFGPRSATQKLCRGFGHDNFHDGFAIAGAGDPASAGVGVAAAADQRRIAHAAGEFTASASRGRCGEEFSVGIERDRADRALFVAAMMGCGMFAWLQCRQASRSASLMRSFGSQRPMPWSLA